MSGDNKSSLDSFNEIPSWYDEPELSTEELSPEVAQRPSSGTDVGKLASIGFGLAALIGLAVVAFISISGGDEPEEIAVGDCVVYEHSDNLIGQYITLASCDPADRGTVGAEDVVGRAAGVLEYDYLEEFPDTDEFWMEASNRCQSMAVDDSLILPFPQARTNSDWADGERTIVCHISPVLTADGRSR